MALALGLTLAMLLAMTPSSRAEITIDAVLVGDPGNPSDSTGYGAVSYIYAIGKFELNLTQYTTFLNAVAATDTYNLYQESMETDLNSAGIVRTGSSGSYSYSVIGSGNRPATYVSWFSAARFANWMANGQPAGLQDDSTTENGAYSLSGATNGVGFAKNAINPNTGTTTTWWIPSENEWYKAAYYDPTMNGVGGYWSYPTQSDNQPGNVIGSGVNQVNYYDGVFSLTQSPTYESNQNYLTDGGAFTNSASFYGTFDQAGNVWEWNDAATISERGIRGGSWNSTTEFDDPLQAYFRTSIAPTETADILGFRLATVPEPSAALLVLIGAAGCCLARRRRSKA